MSAILAAALVGGVIAYVSVVHSYYRHERRVCSTYPYYRLRDQVVWDMLRDPERASEKELLYELLNKIVHHTDTIGWRFISATVQDVTLALLERKEPPPPTPLDLSLVNLVIADARRERAMRFVVLPSLVAGAVCAAYFLVVFSVPQNYIALTGGVLFGVIFVLLTDRITIATLRGLKFPRRSTPESLPTTRETMQQVRSLDAWRQRTLGTAA
jgi:hypothetical protein